MVSGDEPGDKMPDRNSAATIDHTEVQVDMSHRGGNSAAISTGGSGEAAYSAGESAHATVVVQTKPDPADKPKDFVVTSCFVIMLCNFCFGLLGWHYGLKANYAWQLGDEPEARHQAKRARIFVIVGIIAGICTYVLALTLFFTISPLRPGA